jgi:hypothetical protein
VPLVAPFVDTVAKALGAFGSRALLKSSAVQLQLASVLTSLCAAESSARALLTHSRGRPLLQAMLAAAHLPVTVRGQAMAAALQVSHPNRVVYLRWRWLLRWGRAA